MMQVPDPSAMAAQSRVIEAQKEVAAMQVAQQIRSAKAKDAINFILLPLQDEHGVHRQDPENTLESKAARAACYRFLEHYFGTTTDLEAGIPVHEVTSLPSPIATA
jgi:hypothetical protein